jgi:formylglycine-generating enzyme required for sulfatase activity
MIRRGLPSARRSGLALLALVAATALASSTSACRRHGHRGVAARGPSLVGGCSARATDPRALVLVHSFTGHGARVGCEIATMLGARYERFGDAPVPGVKGAAPSADAIVARLQLGGVRRLFLGFPIWGAGEPSDPVRALLERLPLAGVEVVPFYTHIHFADPEALAKLDALVRARGGTPRPPIALKTPFWLPAAAIDRLVHRALAERPELLALDVEPVPQPSCGPKGGAGEEGRCAIPAGRAWVGDFGGEGAPDGYVAPRVRTVASFEIDRAEVTVARYAKCVAGGACPEVRFDDGACGSIVAGDVARPAPCISFEAAKRYSAFVGMRLPTEAEWVRAARGDGTRAFPWGDSFATDGDPLRGNFGEKPATGIPHYALVEPSRPWPADGVPGLTSPCRFPGGDAAFGLCDLAGSLAEWVVGDGSAALLKGGSWLDGEPAAFRIGARGRLSLERDDLGLGMYLTGFRCARSTP